MSARRCRVLFVDDSNDDHLLFRTALRRLAMPIDLLPPLRDGAEAIAYLAGQGEFGNREIYPLPDLLVLDLKMPRKTGHEVLAWLQAQSFHSVTVVFSASDRGEDVSQANALGARCYFVKPGDWHDWIDAVRVIIEQCPLRTASPRDSQPRV